MATTDKKLREIIIAGVITILTTLGACVGNDLYSRVSALEKNAGKSDTGIAVIQQKLEDFKTAFDKFVDDDKEWKNANGRLGNQGNHR